ncbi:MAG: Helix-hairpin-helix motif [Planctomycetota bacterium]|jgi:hypothetical protein
MSRVHPVLTPAAVTAGAGLVIGLTLLRMDAFAFASAASATGAGARVPRARPTFVPAAHRIDLETAPSAELALLPEVGPGMAAAIVADRAVRGPFGRVDALARVAGVGRVRIEAIRPFARAGEIGRAASDAHVDHADEEGARVDGPARETEARDRRGSTGR